MTMPVVVRRTLSMSIGAVSAVAAVVALAGPGAAAGASYVALGDSYSSGTGTRAYLNDGTSCQRSVYAYPSLIASSRGYSLTFRACSGAKVSDVTSAQLPALSATTSYVSISVGGNDAGFASVLTECAKPGWMSNCNARIDTAQAYIRNTLPSALSTLYSAIRAKSPNAKVTVVGYPRIFNGDDCNALTWFSPQEESRLNGTADLLNSTLAAQAAAKGFAFANPTSRFVGHAVCDRPEWLNGLSNPISESYHPNVTGHASGYLPAVSPSMIGATVAASPSVLARAAETEPELTAKGRANSAADRGIKPAVVEVPDLKSRQAKSAAARAGVDLNSQESIDRADAEWSAREAAEWEAAQH